MTNWRASFDRHEHECDTIVTSRTSTDLFQRPIFLCRNIRTSEQKWLERVRDWNFKSEKEEIKMLERENHEKRNFPPEKFNLKNEIQALSTSTENVLNSSLSSTSRRWVSVIQFAVVEKIPHLISKHFFFIFRNNRKCWTWKKSFWDTGSAKATRKWKLQKAAHTYSRFSERETFLSTSKINKFHGHLIPTTKVDRPQTETSSKLCEKSKKCAKIKLPNDFLSLEIYVCFVRHPHAPSIHFRVS